MLRAAGQTETKRTMAASAVESSAAESSAVESSASASSSSAAASPAGPRVFTIMLIALLVLSGVFWWRSRTRVDVMTLFVAGDGRAQVLASGGGRVCIALTNVAFGSEYAWTGMCSSVPGDLPDIIKSGVDVSRIQLYPPPDPAKVAAGGSPFGEGYLGFTFATSQNNVIEELPDSKLVYALIPHWAIATALLAWITWRMFGPAAQRHRRLRRGQCVNCGYDLRASSERCPECGAEITNAARASAEVTS